MATHNFRFLFKHLDLLPPVKKTKKNNNTNSKTSKSVYGFNPYTSVYKTWPYISECTKFFKEGKLKILELLKRE